MSQLTPKQCADEIERLMQDGQKPSEVVSAHPHLAPGLDLLIAKRPPRGQGSSIVAPKPSTEGLE